MISERRNKDEASSEDEKLNYKDELSMFMQNKKSA